MILDISKLLSKYNKTMLYYAISIFEDYDIREEEIINFLKNEVGNYKYILEQLNNDIFNLQKIEVLIDNNTQYDISDLSKKDYFYNKSVSLIYIDRINSLINDIGYDISEESIINNISKLKELSCLVIRLNFSIANYAMEKEHEENKFDFSKKYVPEPHLIGFIYTCLNYWNNVLLLSTNIESEEFRTLMKLKIKTDIDIIRSKLNFVGFMLSIIFILDSPFYDSNTKTMLYEIYNQIQEFMYNCYIYSFFVEYGNISNCQENRGASDKTTRIQILFVLDNGQSYSLRIDLPHKGVGYTHLNINDMNEEYALPINREQFNLLKEQIDINVLNKLFYSYEDKYWFCSEFNKEIEILNLSSESKKLLERQFRKQSHFQVTHSLCDEMAQLDLLNEHRIYLDRICNYFSNDLKGEVINHRDLLKRSQLKIDFNILCLLYSFSNEEEIKKLFIEKLYRYYEYKKYPIEELARLDIIFILEIIADEIY